MKITSITTQQKNKSRYNIFLDGSYSFSIDGEVLVHFQLAKDKTLTSVEVAEIVEADKRNETYNKAIHYLARRIRSKKEIHDYLTKHGYDQTMIRKTIAKLIEMNYLDDQDFAIRFVRTQVKTTLKGPKVIERELIGKGITKELITEALLYYKKEEQLKNAKKQTEKMIKRNQKVAHKYMVAKISTDLLQKGYSQEIIAEAIAEINENITEEMEETILASQIEKLIHKNKRFEPAKAKQKTIQSLLQKGFSYDRIQTFFSQNDIHFEKQDI